MEEKKGEFKISEEKLKIMDNAEFVKVVKKEPKEDDVYVPITKNGKKFFLVVQR
jgi:hypothetical protein